MLRLMPMKQWTCFQKKQQKTKVRRKDYTEVSDAAPYGPYYGKVVRTRTRLVGLSASAPRMNDVVAGRWLRISSLS